MADGSRRFSRAGLSGGEFGFDPGNSRVTMRERGCDVGCVDLLRDLLRAVYVQGLELEKHRLFALLTANIKPIITSGFARKMLSIPSFAPVCNQLLGAGDSHQASKLSPRMASIISQNCQHHATNHVQNTSADPAADESICVTITNQNTGGVTSAKIS